MTYFDDWIKNKKIDGDEIYLSSVSSEKIWSMTWASDFMEVAETNGNIEEFIKEKNNKLYDLYVQDNIAPLEAEKLSLQEEVAKIEDVQAKALDFNKQLDEFSQDVEIIVSKYPEERRRSLKSLLTNYARTGQFVSENDQIDKMLFNKVTRPPEGFFNKIKSGGKIKEANKSLDDFIKKYEQINLKAKADDLSESMNGDECFKSKLSSITELNTERANFFNEDIDQYFEQTKQTLSKKNNEIEKRNKNIEDYKTSFEESNIKKVEDEIIRDTVQEIRAEIKNPKQYNAADWVEGLGDMPDDELVMFNIGSSKKGKASQRAIENILEHNGLSVGENTNQWLLRRELRHNSDEGCFELLSPVMTAKDAKKIMPKLIDDFEKAGVSKGLVIPANPKELFKDVVKEPFSQNVVDAGLEKIVFARRVQEVLSNPNQTITNEAKTKVMSRLGINSFDELPESYGSLKELEAKFPKDKYLFSGTMASDDYCQLSSRNGRIGKVYATPDINYAAKYDGATNVGSTLGTSATGDCYVSTAAGQINGHKAHVGFINIYEQNPKDKFFENFGMEDYRHNDFINMGGGKPEIKTFDLWEPSQNGPVILHKQATPADRHVLTHEQAINGYIYRPQAFTIDGKDYFQASYNAETYVTPEKNPLKAKIMHLSYIDEQGHPKDLYIPVSDKSDEAIRHLINSRQAETKDSFVNSLKTDVYNRFEKQKEEFNKGIVYPAREEDFELKRQSKLLTSETKNTDDLVKQAQSAENAAVKSQNTVVNRMSQLRGINQPTHSPTATGATILEKTAVHTGANLGKASESAIGTLAKADNTVNKAIDKTIDQGSKLLNNTAVGKAYGKAVKAVSNTKVVKVIGKGAEKTVKKAAQTAVGKSVIKVVAKTTGSAVGKSLLKKIPLVSAAAGCYFAWDRVKNGDWKGACGEIASGVAGCFPGLGTGISTAIDAGLAAKDIGGAVAGIKSVQSETKGNTVKNNAKIGKLILQKQGQLTTANKATAKSSEISNQTLQQKIAQHGRI